MTKPYEIQLPPVRASQAMKNGLEAIAAKSVTRRISDHIRLAIQEYIERHNIPSVSAPVESDTVSAVVTHQS